MKACDYHSALKPERFKGCERSLFEEDGNLVFWYNVTEGYCARFDTCNVLYAEPAWQKGYVEFENRAGMVAEGFSQYLKGICDFILKSNVPVYLVVGKHFLKKLPPYQEMKEITLNRGGALLLSYRALIPEFITTNVEMIQHLALNFDRVGDFSCGYGNTGRIFVQSGKKFVMSDFNKKCIAYVGENYHEWKGAVKK